MDDKELDRLFGRDSGSDEEKETLKKDRKVPSKKPEKKAVKPEPKHERKEESSGKEESKEKEEPKKESGKENEPEVKAEKQAEKETPEEAEKEAEKEPAKEPEKDEKPSSDEDAEDKASEEKGEEPEDKEDSDESDEEESEGQEPDEDDGSGEKTPDKKKSKPEDKGAKPAGERRQKAPGKTAPAKQTDLRDAIPLSGKSIFAIFLAVLVVVMVIIVIFHPAFRVRNATVEGNVALTDQEILAAAGLEYDSHLMSGISGNIFDILKLDYGKTEERIMKENPYIEDIRITIKLPSTVEIKVKERSKICYIRTPDGYAALDKDGIVLELSSFDSGKNVRPVICGLEVKYAELGKPVVISNMNDYKKAIIVLGAILAADNASVGGDYQMFENTAEVRVLPSGYIFLTIYSPSGHLIQIKLNGTESIGDKTAWLLYVFNGDGFDKITVDGALDMTGDEYIFDEYD
ncbi:MAG: FtsQ-type POTRA domain-containing protein [Eubacteriales bacterium]|nr:FtsQ-type POTRA domain-containing protein [Eubacteriales bacterium]